MRWIVAALLVAGCGAAEPPAPARTCRDRQSDAFDGSVACFDLSHPFRYELVSFKGLTPELCERLRADPSVWSELLVDRRYSGVNSGQGVGDLRANIGYGESCGAVLYTRSVLPPGLVLEFDHEKPIFVYADVGPYGKPRWVIPPGQTHFRELP